MDTIDEELIRFYPFNPFRQSSALKNQYAWVFFLSFLNLFHGFFYITLDLVKHFQRNVIFRILAILSSPLYVGMTLMRQYNIMRL